MTEIPRPRAQRWHTPAASPMELTVTLNFEVSSLDEGERLRKALHRSARRVAGASLFVSSSYCAPVISADDEVDE